MGRQELAQTRSDLLDLAVMRGYDEKELGRIAQAYRLMQSYMNACYRPCGRPFINHLVGTAGVLVRYGFKIEIVLAGMMHTIYTHRHPGLSGPAGAREAGKLLGGAGQPVEKLVRGYSLRGERGLMALPGDAGLSVFDAELVAIAAANEVDMHLSGEYRYSRRIDPGLLPQMDLISHVCKLLGVRGLSDTLAHASHSVSPASGVLKTVPVGSYRIKDGSYQPIKCELPDPSTFPGALE